MMLYFENILGIILILPLALFITYAGKHLHKNEYRYYLGATVLAMTLSILAFIGNITGNPIRVPLLYTIINQGHLSFAFFALVMYGGAFKTRSTPKIVIVRVRRELAIIGFILLFPHAIGRLSLAIAGVNPTGLTAMLVMTPLFITSFPVIRRTFHPRTWKRVHLLAYAAYFLIYIHVAFTIYTPANLFIFNTTLSAWTYHLLFAVYLAMKLIYHIIPAIAKRQQKKEIIR